MTVRLPNRLNDIVNSAGKNFAIAHLQPMMSVTAVLLKSGMSFQTMAISVTFAEVRLNMLAQRITNSSSSAPNVEVNGGMIDGDIERRRIMQSRQDEEVLQTVVGEPAALVEKMPAQATHHVISELPSVGDELTIKGLVWVVERIKGQHGWMRLRLKKFKERSGGMK